MGSPEMLKYIIMFLGIAFAGLMIAYFVLNKKMQNSDYKKIQKLRQGTKQSSFSMEILYQRLYLVYSKIPLIKRYIFKVRRKLEIINLDDEFTTRLDSAKIFTKTALIVVPLILLTILITRNNSLLMLILLLFEIFMIDTFVDGSVDKLDNKLLKEQIDFFAEIRHAYHEYNMVEEAIYQISLDDEKVISRQGEKIYEILIADDPEMELEKYYDTAPNSYLKEFAGVSYLTKEFGDRTDSDGSSLYLKNVNNITQEMQLEILKRDKLNYVFQSLSIIALAPVLGLEILKSWCISNFSFTASFYNGTKGMIVQILIVVLTIISYILVRTLKDNGSTKMDTQNTENPWQEKLYKKPIFKKIFDLFIPKKGTKDYRVVQLLLKDAASKLKMEWLYINRIMMAIAVCIFTLFIAGRLHSMAINFVYTEPVTDYNLIGSMSEKDTKKAMELTEQDNYFLDMFRGKLNTTQEDIRRAMEKSKFYVDAKDELLDKDSKRVKGKLDTINSEYLKWTDFLVSFGFAFLGYMGPYWILFFRKIMRNIEMEDEVMQFQTIILMLMKIERVSVEMILEWLERYANIFKDPISNCVNAYEAGAWEAIDEMERDVTFEPFIRLCESLKAAVEKIPIREAFDELDTDREYHREKRKESNQRLITRKGMIGKVVGFAPLICLFVGYLIIPLVFIGMTSMSSSFSSMQTM